MFSEIAEIALVAARLGQFLQFLKTRVILILNFTRPHAITHTYTGIFIAIGVFVSSDPPCDVGGLTHELGHTLGFFHEHSRPDRDDYVKILWHNIRSGEHKQLYNKLFARFSWKKLPTKNSRLTKFSSYLTSPHLTSPHLISSHLISVRF